MSRSAYYYKPKEKPPERWLIEGIVEGNPRYGYASAESFMSTCKLEEVYVNEYRDFDDALRSTARFIEVVYNRKRLHSALGSLPPVEHERLWLQVQ